jgi:thiol-disulfide isomerase/thioredoxin
MGDPSDPFVIGLSLSMLFMVSVPFLLVGFIGVQLVQALNPKAYYRVRNRIVILLKPRYVYAVLIIVIVPLLFYALNPSASRKDLILPRAQLVGQINLNGDTLTESQQFNNKVVLINFFASWCEYCRTEVAGLGDLYRDHETEGVEVIGITYDFEHPDVPTAQSGIPLYGIIHHLSLPNALRTFLQANRASYPVISNAPKIEQSLGGISAIPTTFLFDRQGTLIKQYFGPPSMAGLKADVEKLLTRAAD